MTRLKRAALLGQPPFEFLARHADKHDTTLLLYRQHNCCDCKASYAWHNQAGDSYAHSGDGNGCRGALHLIAPAVGLSTPVGLASRRAHLQRPPTCGRVSGFCRQRAFR